MASPHAMPGTPAAHAPQRRPLALKVDIAQASDPGRDPNKQVNEDSCGFSETRFGHLCVLCDGMGGHYGGQEASRRAITTIFEALDRMPDGATPAQALKASVEEAARRVYELGGPADNKARPGSTVVALLMHDGGLDVAHVGDSRAYIIRSNQIYPLTRDHSMVQGLIDAGYITEEQAIGHPDSNKITRALGMKPEVDVELRPEPMELFPGDLLLQASDGLTDLALSPDILAATRQALASGDLTFACNQLVRLANDRGGHDNITVQIVRVLAVAPKVGATLPGAPAAAIPTTIGPTGAPSPTVGPGAPPRPGPAPTQAGATLGPGAARGTPTLDEGETVHMGRSPAHQLPPAGTPQPPQAGWGADGTPAPPSGRSAGMSPYHQGSPQQLPLPPPAAGSAMGGSAMGGPAMGASAMAGPALGASAMAGSPIAPTMGPSSLPAGALASGSMSAAALAGVHYPVPLARPAAPRKKSQIVYVVLGLSVLVALLLVLLLWALFVR